jgi:hypothetical protein
MNPFDNLKTGQFTPEMFATPEEKAAKLEESRKPMQVQTPDIRIDASESWSIPLETLQAFWKFVYEAQPGLIERFKYSQGIK